jgi:hypothetical protein
MPHQQRKQGQTRMNINTETWGDGNIVYTFTRAKIDYTVVHNRKKGSLTCIKETTSEAAAWRLIVTLTASAFEGKKAPKFIIPIFELIAA